MKYPMTDVIATRRLLWRRTDGTQATVEVRIGLPAYMPRKGKLSHFWYCPYEIERFEGAKVDELANDAASGTGEMLTEHAILGEDSVQALCLALATVGAEIASFAGSSDVDWAHQPNFGFPLMPLAQAADKSR